MMSLAAELLPFVGASLWAAFATLVRIGAMMATLPAFGDQVIPMRVRFALAVMFTLIVTPAIAGSLPPAPAAPLAIAAILLPEVLTGLIWGLFLRFFILALQITGAIAAQSTSLSQIFGGTAGVDPQPAIGHLFVVAGTALAAMTGLHTQAASYMIHSYGLVPFGTLPTPGVIAAAGIDRIATCFALSFSLAAPFLIASLVYNVILGVINRAMPQLMVSFVGAPALTAGGLLLLVVAAPLILGVWIAAFQGFLLAPFSDGF